MSTAGRDATAETMINALVYTIDAMDAAAELDVDRTDEDRQFFATERDALKPRLDALTAAHQQAAHHALRVARRAQARVLVGDAVLDRGVSKGKKRMVVEAPEKADFVFGSDVSELIRAPREKEPALVLDAVGRLETVANFQGKGEMMTDLTQRAEAQKENFRQRAEAAAVQAKLDTAVELAVQEGADALYGLEKRLLERFKRETGYVKALFLDVSPAKKGKADKDE